MKQGLRRYINRTEFDAWVGLIKIPPGGEETFSTYKAEEDETYECVDLGYVGPKLMERSQGHRLLWKRVESSYLEGSSDE